MTWTIYELYALYNYATKICKYKLVRVRERTVMRTGSGTRLLRERVVTRWCRVYKGKVVLV